MRVPVKVRQILLLASVIAGAAIVMNLLVSVSVAPVEKLHWYCWMVPPGIQLFRALYSGLDAAAHGSLSNSTSAAGHWGTASDPCRMIPSGRISKLVYSRSGSTSSGPEEVAPGAPTTALL